MYVDICEECLQNVLNFKFPDLQSRALTPQDAPDLPGRGLAGQPGGAEGGPAQWRPGAQAHADPGQEEETVLTSRGGEGILTRSRLRKSSELVASIHLHLLPTSNQLSSQATTLALSLTALYSWLQDINLLNKIKIINKVTERGIVLVVVTVNNFHVNTSEWSGGFFQADHPHQPEVYI